MIKNENIRRLITNFHENKLSHIFLIETNDKEQTLSDLLNLVKLLNCPQQFSEQCTLCNLCHLIDTSTLPTLLIISPDGQAIKKSQMEELKLTFSHKPYISKYNIYIINDAEKFNSSSANSMLKFIEEPEPNTIGFLITDNKENVILTIKSRCEILRANYDEPIGKNWDQKLIDLFVSYVYDIEIVKTKGIVANKKIIDSKLERDQILEMFQFLLQLYTNLLNGNLEYQSLQQLKEYDIKKLISRIQLVQKMIERLNYNVNINLLLDDFILRLEVLQ